MFRIAPILTAKVQKDSKRHCQHYSTITAKHQICPKNAIHHCKDHDNWCDNIAAPLHPKNLTMFEPSNANNIVNEACMF
jgi:hypothetical protein